MKKVSFRQAIKELGYEIVDYHNGYNYRSAFAKDKDNQLWYFSISDLRDTHPTVMRRTAEDTSDYTGGRNMFDVEDMLEDLGLYIKENRKNCDYNGE